MKKIRTYIIFTALIISACDLESDLKDASETNSTAVTELLSGAYSGLRDYQPQDNLFALTEHSSDEVAGPTRGSDWDDAGVWRVLHTHTWTPSHPFINNVWIVAGRNSFNAQQVLCEDAPAEVSAQAVFLRAFSDFILLDNFGVFQRRECGSSFLLPPVPTSRAEAANALIQELETALPDLPTAGAPTVATQDAARALLMKLYLNKAVYEATDTDGTPQPGPYSFSSADMDKVIELADDISAGGYMIDDAYFDNFIPDNGAESSELIFVSENTDGEVSGAVRTRWHMTLHYNQNPAGWNGFVALVDLYNLFEENDARRYTELPYLTENNSGINAGFLVGQQYDAEENPLTDRQGNPLVFTPEFSLLETGTNLEVTGIRAIKYIPDFPSDDDLSDNDYVFFRYADVLLMKAEAILRGGNSGETALDMVNSIRMLRGASELSSVDLDELLDERARELYWEGWRRNDQIRFNAFMGTWQEKNSPSDATKLLFPIPAEALSTNPELTQNPGY